MSNAVDLKEPIEGGAGPCLCCSTIRATLPMDAVIAVGFGDAHVSRDRELVYTEPSARDATKDCHACGGIGETATSVVCGTCGGLGFVDDPDVPRPEYWEASDAEKMAAADPEHDWRIVLNGPLHGETYQRHGPGLWHLVEKNNGFA